MTSFRSCTDAHGNVVACTEYARNCSGEYLSISVISLIMDNIIPVGG